MERHVLDAATADALAPAWDAAVDATIGLDRFCASSDWSFAAACSFPEVPPAIVMGTPGAGGGWAGLRRTMAPDGTRFLLGLDPTWAFASPVVGDPERAAAALAALVVEETERDGWDLLVVAGQRGDLPLSSAVLEAMAPVGELLTGPEEVRVRADLSDGFEGWWGRRSSRFRQRLRRLERDAAAAGIEIGALDVGDAAEPADLVARAAAIEAVGWKGPAETGIATDGLADFYSAMLARLAPTGRVRMLVATRDGEDLGYVLGGVRAETYRGFQLGHSEAGSAFGVGHLLQLAAVRGAAGEGLTSYDLGMDMDYKHRWADRAYTTTSLVVRPHQRR